MHVPAAGLPPLRGLDHAHTLTVTPVLRNDDVVEVARLLVPALLAVGSEPYAERPRHAGLQGRPRVHRVFGPRVSLLRRPCSRTLEVHGVVLRARSAFPP